MTLLVKLSGGDMPITCDQIQEDRGHLYFSLSGDQVGMAAWDSIVEIVIPGSSTANLAAE